MAQLEISMHERYMHALDTLAHALGSRAVSIDHDIETALLSAGVDMDRTLQESDYADIDPDLRVQYDACDRAQIALRALRADMQLLCMIPG